MGGKIKCATGERPFISISELASQIWQCNEKMNLVLIITL